MDDKRNKIKPNSIGRALAFQALYQQEFNPKDSSENDWNRLYDCYCEDSPTALADEELSDAFEYARRLFEGTIARRSEIDDLLNKALDKRTLKHTTAVDRNILRVAAYEMRFLKTPKAIVISEAIELGKTFGEKSSQAFLNGVLDQVGSFPPAGSKELISESEDSPTKSEA